MSISPLILAIVDDWSCERLLAFLKLVALQLVALTIDFYDLAARRSFLQRQTGTRKKRVAVLADAFPVAANLK